LNAARLAVRIVKESGSTWEPVITPDMNGIAVEAARVLAAENDELRDINRQIGEWLAQLRARRLQTPASWEAPRDRGGDRAGHRMDRRPDRLGARVRHIDRRALGVDREAARPPGTDHPENRALRAGKGDRRMKFTIFRDASGRRHIRRTPRWTSW
jgi:hypothetical protein